MSTRIASIGTALALAALAGTGLAAGAAKPPTTKAAAAAAAQQAVKVAICHKGRTIRVAPSAVPAHKAHGDQLGACKA